MMEENRLLEEQIPLLQQVNEEMRKQIENNNILIANNDKIQK